MSDEMTEDWSNPSEKEMLPEEEGVQPVNTMGKRAVHHPDSVWHHRWHGLTTPCHWSDDLIKNGVPRIRNGEGKLRSMPKFLGFQEHQITLIDMFPAEFSKEGEPAALITYYLCGYQNCINPDHLPIIFRKHKKGIDAIRLELMGTDRWWTGANEFYSTYEDHLHEEKKTRSAKEGKRKHQRKIQARISRKKQRFSESEVARAVNIVFGLDMETWTEIENIFLNETRDNLHKSIIMYVPRKIAIDEGKAKPGFVPDGRANYLKNYRGKKK